MLRNQKDIEIITEGGKQTSKEWFSSSTYRATADEVTVGTKKAEAAPEPTPATQTETPKTEEPATDTSTTEENTNSEQQPEDSTPIGAE